MIERPCQKNPELIDKFSVDEDRIKTLLECKNVEAMKNTKEVKRH